MSHLYFELGARKRFPRLTGAIAWKATSTIEGVLAWARDERTGEYVRVYETGPEDGAWVQGQHEGHWTTGNAMTVNDAQRLASAAYRKINGRARRAA